MRGTRFVFRIGILLSVLLVSEISFSAEDGVPYHYGGAQTQWDRKNDTVFLKGQAFVRMPGEILKADEILFDKKTKILTAKGNSEYVANETVINSEEMVFNQNTRTGTIYRGRVSNNRFNLTGERINKIGLNRYTTRWGEFSTCRDCPNSWAMSAEDVDIEFEGYAYLSNVTIWIKGAAAFWLPYFIFPVKKERQSGVLFPRLGVDQNNGFMGVLPIFWATSQNTDMTFGIGHYTKRGNRFEWEGRYSLAPRSEGSANVYYLNDRTFQKHNRWGLKVSQNHQFSHLFSEKLRLREASDNNYPIFVGDVRDQNEGYLTSDFLISYASRNISSFFSLKRFRNLMNTNSSQTLRETEFDGNTVQLYPSAAITTNERPLFNSPISAGITLGVMNFSRSAGAFDKGNPDTISDPNPVLGIDPIRKATRVSMTPSIYTAFRPFDVLSVTPSLKYHAYYYSFGNEMNALDRGYLLFQTDIATQFEKIYDTDDPDIPRIKHLIRPTLTYSAIPYEKRTDNHPFLAQIDYARGKGYSGYYFDNYDIVPLDSTPGNVNYFYPLGNSLTYGFTSQVIRRRGAVDKESPIYQTIVELNAGQTFNLREFRNDDPRPLSRLYSDLTFNFDQFTSYTSYFYYPYEGGEKHQFSTTFTYILERATHQRFLAFDRSIDVTYTRNRVNPNETQLIQTALRFSLNDYLLPSFGAQYDLTTKSYTTAFGGLIFQSPSQCWRLAATVAYSKQNRATTWSPEFAINFTGDGFFGVNQ